MIEFIWVIAMAIFMRLTLKMANRSGVTPHQAKHLLGPSAFPRLTRIMCFTLLPMTCGHMHSMRKLEILSGGLKFCLGRDFNRICQLFTETLLFLQVMIRIKMAPIQALSASTTKLSLSTVFSATMFFMEFLQIDIYF